MRIYETILEATKKIREQDNRSFQEIFLEIASEFGEFGEEINIHYGSSYKKSKEGPLVEAIDVLIGLIYIIHKLNPMFTEDEICDIIKQKCNKWENAVLANVVSD